MTCLLVAQAPAQVSDLGPGCGWGLEGLSIHGQATGGTKLAFWTYQPYISEGGVERWIVVSSRMGGTAMHGACQIYVDHLSAAYWRYPDHSTAAYFLIPLAARGMTFYVQAIVKARGRSDLTNGFRVVIR